VGVGVGGGGGGALGSLSSARSAWRLVVSCYLSGFTIFFRVIIINGTIFGAKSY
jgi:hypothetical protein